MKFSLLLASILIFGLANAAGQGKTLTTDPLTNLPLIPATDGGQYVGNEPNKLPDAQICKSKMQGNFYFLFKIEMDAATAWYASHLAGFKKVEGYESGRSQVGFYNSDRTILIFLTGEPGAKGENTAGYSVGYERYQPGISEKTITGLTQGKIACN
jgi:hypothetical protein